MLTINLVHMLIDIFILKFNATTFSLHYAWCAFINVVDRNFKSNFELTIDK